MSPSAAGLCRTRFFLAGLCPCPGLPTDFPQITPAKPKTPPPSSIQNGLRRVATASAAATTVTRAAASPDRRFAPESAHWRPTGRRKVEPGRPGSKLATAIGSTVPASGYIIGKDRGRTAHREGSRHRPRDTGHGIADQGHDQHVRAPGESCEMGGGGVKTNRNRGDGCAARPPAPLFFSMISPYIGRAGSPAMEINCRRNKPFGPGGSTRRLHPSPSSRWASAGAKQDRRGRKGRVFSRYGSAVIGLCNSCKRQLCSGCSGCVTQFERPSLKS